MAKVMMSNNEAKKYFGDHLRYVMARENVSQAELSYRAGIAQALISQYCNGRSLPNVYNAYVIAKSLDCTVDELIDPCYSKLQTF